MMIIIQLIRLIIELTKFNSSDSGEFVNQSNAPTRRSEVKGHTRCVSVGPSSLELDQQSNLDKCCGSFSFNWVIKLFLLYKSNKNISKVCSYI